MGNPGETVEDFEHAMDALFSSLSSTHVAVRHGEITDPKPLPEPKPPRLGRMPTKRGFWTTCPRCGELCEPHVVRCDCGCRVVL